MLRRLISSCVVSASLMLSLSACTVNMAGSKSTTATGAGLRESPLRVCAIALISIPQEWSAAFQDWAAVEGTEAATLSALEAMEAVTDKLRKYFEPWYAECLNNAVQENPELKEYAEVLARAPEKLLNLIAEQLTAWDEGRYNAAVEVAKKITTQLEIMLWAIQGNA